MTLGVHGGKRGLPHADAPLATLDSALAEQLGGLSVEEQRRLAAHLEECRASGADLTGELAFVHEALKGRWDPEQASHWEEVATVKAPPVVKEYFGAERIPLPADIPTIDHSFDRVLRARASRRDFGQHGVSLGDLAALLHWSYGIRRGTFAYNTRDFPLRYTPTSGGLQSPELYVVVNDVEGLAPGLYHYNASARCLAVLELGLMRRTLVNACIMQEFVHHASLVVIVTAVIDRLLWKYGPRAYRFAHIDIGALAQSMSLVAAGLGVRACIVGGFVDDAINRLLRVDGKHEFSSLMVAVGPKPQILEADPTSSS